MDFTLAVLCAGGKKLYLTVDLLLYYCLLLNTESFHQKYSIIVKPVMHVLR